MRTTRKTLEAMVAQMCQMSGTDYELNCQHTEGPRYRILSHNSSKDVSPRLPAGPLHDWITAFCAGWYAHEELGQCPVKVRFAKEHGLTLPQLNRLCRMAIRCKKSEEYAISNNRPEYRTWADRDSNAFEDAARSYGIQSIRWPSLLPQVRFDNHTEDWFDLPID